MNCIRPFSIQRKERSRRASHKSHEAELEIYFWPQLVGRDLVNSTSRTIGILRHDVSVNWSTALTRSSAVLIRQGINWRRSVTQPNETVIINELPIEFLVASYRQLNCRANRVSRSLSLVSLCGIISKLKIPQLQGGDPDFLDIPREKTWHQFINTELEDGNSKLKWVSLDDM